METNPVASGDPNAFAVEADDSGWDDDDSGATLATDGPSFEMPSNIPSPITVPPPVIPAPRPLQATLVGMMPEDVRAYLPKPASTRVMPAVGPAPASVRVADAPFAPVMPPPMVLAAEDLAELTGQQEDASPTMSGAPSPPSNRPLRDDAMPGLGFVPPAPPTIDNDVETMAINADDPWGRLPDAVDDDAEDTRPVSRDEMNHHRDAQVVIADDAVGDDATLAIGPGQIDLGLVPYGAPPLRPGSSDHLRAAPQNMPQGMYGGPGMQVQQAQQAPPPWQSFDPMVPQAQHGIPGGQFAPSGQGWGPPPHAPTAPGPSAPHGMMMHAAVPSPPWLSPPSAPPAGAIRFTPQLMLLLGVGVICVAIFVIGVVLFVTTKF